MIRLLSWMLAIVVLTSSVALAEKKKKHSAAIDPEKAAQELLELHNKERQAAGAGALRLNNKLMAAAQEYAQYLAINNKFSHTADGTPSSRIKKQGGKFHAIAENIAKGCLTPDSAVTGWMHSDGHRKNLLSKRYSEVGFGVARAENGKLLWVADFGD